MCCGRLRHTYSITRKKEDNRLLLPLRVFLCCVVLIPVQVRSGDIPEAIHEAEEGGGGGANGVGQGPVVKDSPMRRRTIAGDTVKRGMPQR